MNFDEAIKAHSTWKMKLSSYINKPDGSLNPNEIAKDNACELGKWLYSADAIQFSNSSEFAELKKAHADFHKEASTIVRRADNGESVSAEIALGAVSNFSKASTTVVSCCMHMKNKAAQ